MIEEFLKKLIIITMIAELQNIDLIPISTRLIMVEDIWDSIARSNADVPVYDWQKIELARRKENFKANPGDAKSWQHVKDSILDILCIRE